MTVNSFLARTVPVAAILIPLVAFGNTGGLLALLAIIVAMVVWATLQTPATTVEYDFAD
jgi:hypothetical protein